MQYFGFDRPSFAFKTYGFGESSPKLQADFTTGAYKLNGAAKTFADLFNFNRAGKAWLVKETGLQEYAADVPRLDNGLLIEQSATNTWTNSTTFSTATIGTGSLLLPSVVTGGMAVRLTQVDRFGTLKISLGVNLNPVTLSFYVDNQLDSDTRLRFTVSGVSPLPKNYTTSKGFANISQSETGTGGLSGLDVYYPTIQDAAKYIDIHMAQLEEGTRKTSMIKTEATPVTRPADFLTSKITGTTVTGDWDSTLTLSIVAGKLVHSGYGRIRSLEIN